MKVGEYYYDTRYDKPFRIIGIDGDDMTVQYIDKKNQTTSIKEIKKSDFDYFVDMGAWNKYTQKFSYFQSGGKVGKDKHTLVVDNGKYGLQNWYLEKIDNTHFYMSNDKDFKGTAHHLQQHRGEPYYEEVKQWLKDTVSKGGRTMSKLEQILDKNGLSKSEWSSMSALERQNIVGKENYRSGIPFAKGGMTDVERQSMIDMGYSEEQIKESEDNPRRGGRFAKGGEIQEKRERIAEYIATHEDLDNYGEIDEDWYDWEFDKKLKWVNKNILTDDKEVKYFFDEYLYAKGGKIGFDGLAKKVAKKYEGKPVKEKFQSEYGKTYSKAEAIEVGKKVAGKVYRQQQSMAKGGALNSLKKQMNDDLDIHSEYYAEGGGIKEKMRLQDKEAKESAKSFKVGDSVELKPEYHKLGYMRKGKVVKIYEDDGDLIVESDNKKSADVNFPANYFSKITYAEGGRTISIVNDGVKYDKSKYKAVYGDYDKDGVVNIDDANPLDKTKKGKVNNEIELKETFDKLLSVKAELDDIMYDAVDTLDEKAPKGADIYARTKTPYSILKKLVEKRMLDPKKGLTDMIGTTIAVENQNELEQVRDDIDSGLLGKVLDRDDFYKSPNAGYRAYHYIVEYKGVPVEVQLKTKNMKKLHQVSHSAYKKGNLDGKKLDAVSILFMKADKGDAKSKTQINKLLKNKKLLTSKVTKKITAKAKKKLMAKGGKTKSTGAKRKTPMTLAKEIRKEGEKWQDAVKRASAILKKEVK